MTGAMSGAVVEEWRRRIRSDTFGRYHYEMGVAIAREGNLAAAVEAFERSIGMLPDFVEAHARLELALIALNQPEKLEQARNRACSSAAGFRYLAPYRLAIDYWRRGNEDDALRSCEQAISVNPGDVRARELRAVLRIDKGDLNAGMGDLAADAEIGDVRDEDLATALYEMGKRCNGEQKLFEAAALFRHAVLFDPQSEEYLVAASRGCRARGQPEQALAYLTRAIDLSPHNPDLKAEAGVLMTALLRFEDAAAILREAMRLQPDSPTHKGCLGMALHGAGRFDEAVTLFQDALSSPEGEALLWPRGYLALSLVALGRSAEAAAIMDDVVRSNKEADWAWLFAGIAWGREGAGRAGDMLRRAVALEPRGSWSLLALADLTKPAEAAERLATRASILRPDRIRLERVMMPWGCAPIPERVEPRGTAS